MQSVRDSCPAPDTYLKRGHCHHSYPEGAVGKKIPTWYNRHRFWPQASHDQRFMENASGVFPLWPSGWRGWGGGGVGGWGRGSGGRWRGWGVREYLPFITTSHYHFTKFSFFESLSSSCSSETQHASRGKAEIMHFLSTEEEISFKGFQVLPRAQPSSQPPPGSCWPSQDFMAFSLSFRLSPRARVLAMDFTLWRSAFPIPSSPGSPSVKPLLSFPLLRASALHCRQL